MAKLSDYGITQSCSSECSLIDRMINDSLINSIYLIGDHCYSFLSWFKFSQVANFDKRDKLNKSEAIDLLDGKWMLIKKKLHPKSMKYFLDSQRSLGHFSTQEKLYTERVEISKYMKENNI